MGILSAAEDIVDRIFGTREAIGLPELAERLGVHRESLRRAASEGRLPAVKVGSRWRVAQEGLRSYLGRSRSTPQRRNAPAGPKHALVPAVPVHGPDFDDGPPPGPWDDEIGNEGSVPF